MTHEDREQIVAAFLTPLADVEPVTLRRRTAPRRRGRAPGVALAAVVTVAIAGAVAAVLVRRPDPKPAPAPVSAALHADGITFGPTGIDGRDPATGRKVRLVGSRLIGAAFSPDRSALAYVTVVGEGADASCRLEVLDLETAAARRIGGCDATFSAPYEESGRLSLDGTPYRLGTIFGPAWSPDGSAVAYVCGRTGPDRAPEPALCLAAADGSASRQIGAGFGAVFSPDGARLAFLRDRPAPKGTDYPFELQLWVADADGANARRQSRLKQNCCVGASVATGWSADGTAIVVRGTLTEVVVPRP